jgi:hypothetical protein
MYDTESERERQERIEYFRLHAQGRILPAEPDVDQTLDCNPMPFCIAIQPDPRTDADLAASTTAPAIPPCTDGYETLRTVHFMAYAEPMDPVVGENLGIGARHLSATLRLTAARLGSMPGGVTVTEYTAKLHALSTAMRNLRDMFRPSRTIKMNRTAKAEPKRPVGRPRKNPAQQPPPAAGHENPATPSTALSPSPQSNTPAPANNTPESS